MDYKMTINMVIDTESKKNTIRDYLKTSLEQQHSNGTLKSWTMNINGTLVPTEDNESYSSEED